MATRKNFPTPKGSAQYRVAYTSQATGRQPRGNLKKRAETAACQDLPVKFPGVITRKDGVNPQSLEGPGHDIWNVMANGLDSSHTNIISPGAGQIPERCYAGWPMYFGGSPLDQTLSESSSPDAASFVSHLMTAQDGCLPVLPAIALTDLSARAALMDEACYLLGQGCQNDTWTAIEVGLALASLNLMWQRAGRVPEPSFATRDVCIVLPPGSCEILGAIVKTDLIRAAGISVHQVFEKDDSAIIAEVSRFDKAPVIVAGPRVGLDGDALRAKALASRLQTAFPLRSIHLGGRMAGPLTAWPDTLALSDDAADLTQQAATVRWLALSALTAIARSRHLS